MLVSQLKNAVKSDVLYGDTDSAVDQKDVLGNTIFGASVAPTVTFTVATMLPSSSFALALDFDPFKSTKISQDYHNSCQELNDSCYSSTELNYSNKVDKGDVLEGDYNYGYPMVDYNDVKVLWM